jgi:restriction system protein
MEGKEFEFLLKLFFQKQGDSVEILPSRRSNGADLIVKKTHTRAVVKVRKQSQPVGPEVVEQVRKVKPSEKADQAWVITNSSFTDEARESASTSGVILLDRNDVIALIGRVPVPTSEFREKYAIWRSYQ